MAHSFPNKKASGNVIRIMFTTVRVLVERSAAVLHVTGFLPARNKFLYDPQVSTPYSCSLSSCLCM